MHDKSASLTVTLRKASEAPAGFRYNSPQNGESLNRGSVALIARGNRLLASLAFLTADRWARMKWSQAVPRITLANSAWYRNKGGEKASPLILSGTKSDTVKKRAKIGRRISDWKNTSYLVSRSGIEPETY